MTTRQIGDRRVTAIGYGAAHLSVPVATDRDQALGVLRTALDSGVTFIDTAAAYVPDGEPGHNEALIAEALTKRPGKSDEVLVGTKGGHFRVHATKWDVDGRPARIRRDCEDSLRALGVEKIDLYSYHLPDDSVPFEETIGAFKELKDEGKIGMVGLSNVGVDHIQIAEKIVEVAAVQNEFSPLKLDSRSVLDYCTQRGIAFTPYSPLGGKARAGSISDLLPAFAKVAEDRGVSTPQVTLAWSLAQSPVVIPITGARRPENLLDSLGALEIELTPDELAALATSSPAAP